jgi:hypothetical protein
MWLEQQPIADVDLNDAHPTRGGRKWRLPVKRWWKWVGT